MNLNIILQMFSAINALNRIHSWKKNEGNVNRLKNLKKYL